MHEFRLPWPPSVNRLWRSLGNRTVLSREGREYFKRALNSLPHGTFETLSGRLVVWVQLSAPTKRAYDIDNRVKATLDVLTHGRVWLDDSQIDELHVSRETPSAGGFVHVGIQVISSEG